MFCWLIPITSAKTVFLILWVKMNADNAVQISFSFCSAFAFSCSGVSGGFFMFLFV